MAQQLLPDEFLVRWGENGELVAAHFVAKTRHLDDAGNLIAVTLEKPKSVAVAGAAGMPLEEILGFVEKAALERVDELAGAVRQREAQAAAAAEEARMAAAEVARMHDDRVALLRAEHEQELESLRSQLSQTAAALQASEARVADLEARSALEASA